MSQIASEPVARKPLRRPTHTAKSAAAVQQPQPAQVDEAEAYAPPAPRQVGGVMAPPPPPVVMTPADGPRVVGGVMQSPGPIQVPSTPQERFEQEQRAREAQARPEVRPELKPLPPPPPPVDPVPGADIGVWVQYRYNDGRIVPAMIRGESRIRQGSYDLLIFAPGSNTMTPRQGVLHDKDGKVGTFQFSAAHAALMAKLAALEDEIKTLKTKK